MAMVAPEQAIRNADGTLWRDRDGRLWLNPYDKRNWEFVKDVCMWAVDMGFHEIQLDYVRFPDSAQGLERRGVLMPGHEEYGPGAMPSAFGVYGPGIGRQGVPRCRCVWVCDHRPGRYGIGAAPRQLADLVDFICPMVYPSHYSRGSTGSRYLRSTRMRSFTTPWKRRLPTRA